MGWDIVFKIKIRPCTSRYRYVLGIPAGVNDFTANVRHVRICNSTDLAFRNLDQVLFPSWYRKFLNKDDLDFNFSRLEPEQRIIFVKKLPIPRRQGDAAYK